MKSTTVKKPVVKTNQIELAIIELADHDGKLSDPVVTVAKHLEVTEREVNATITRLKKLKLLVAHRKRNSPKFGFVKINQSLLDRLGKSNHKSLNGNGAKPIPEQNQNDLAPKPKPIWVVIDHDNVYQTERHTGQRVSLSKFKEYIREFGDIFATEIFVPHHFYKEQNQRHVDYIWLSGCIAIHCPNSVKDKDQVDNLIMDRVRQITYMYPQTEVWIVSRDADFLRLIELNKDRGLHTIKLVNIFDIPEVLGYNDKEFEMILSRPVAHIMRSAELLTPLVLANETDEQKLIRHTIAWLKRSDDVIIFRNHRHFVERLKSHLNKTAKNILAQHPGFPVSVGTALKELEVIRQLDHPTGYKLLINKEHTLFTIEDPQTKKQIAHV